MSAAVSSRRKFLGTIGLGAVSLAVPGFWMSDLVGRTARRSNEKLNFLFILMDDMGWSDLGCYGNKFHETPNIDRLSREGMRFTDAYAACPVCSPTRASILTGQYPARVGMTDFIPGWYRPWAKLTVPENRLELPAEAATFAEMLKEDGYATGYVGKWDVGKSPEFGPQKQGFDAVAEAVPRGRDKWVTSFTDATLEFIAANRDRPFMFYLSHHTVHIPLLAPPTLVDKYKSKPKPKSGVNNPVYAAMIEHLDNSIGQILGKLDEWELAGRTVVIFFSDNGGLRRRFDGRGEIVTTNAPLRSEKGTLYEGGIRVPLIVRCPGVVKSGAICSAPVSSVDFYPTLLELAGVKDDSQHVLDGRSLVPLLTGTGKFERDALFWHYPHYHHSTPAGAVRQGDWKLMEFYEDGRLELYNLRRDVGEAVNLAGRMPEKAAGLRRKLAAWRKSVGAKMPRPNPEHDPARANKWGGPIRRSGGQ
ncbi:MAG: sulfatase [Phycisphaerales bacterium]|nr:MAG: sulfatase [Phycisphaerales bacterium]